MKHYVISHQHGTSPSTDRQSRHIHCKARILYILSWIDRHHWHHYWVSVMLHASYFIVWISDSDSDSSTGTSAWHWVWLWLWLWLWLYPVYALIIHILSAEITPTSIITQVIHIDIHMERRRITPISK